MPVHSPAIGERWRCILRFLFQVHHLDGEGALTMTHCVCARVARLLRILSKMRAASSLRLRRRALRLCGIETQRLRTVNPFVIARHNFEFVREGDFVVAIETVDYRKIDTEFVKNICVESHLCKIGHTEQLVSRLAGIDKRAKKVEQCTYSNALRTGPTNFIAGLKSWACR